MLTKEEFIKKNNVNGLHSSFGTVATIIPSSIVLDYDAIKCSVPLKEYRNILTDGVLFIGGIEMADNIDFITLFGITAVISVCTSEERDTIDETLKRINIKHHTIDIIDNGNLEIVADGVLCCKDICEFINEEIRKGGGVLVHCVAGMNRSPAIVTAYLMQYQQYHFSQTNGDTVTVDEIINYIKSKRGCTNVFPQVIRQLNLLHNTKMSDGTSFIDPFNAFI